MKRTLSTSARVHNCYLYYLCYPYYTYYLNQMVLAITEIVAVSVLIIVSILFEQGKERLVEETANRFSSYIQ